MSTYVDLPAQILLGHSLSDNGMKFEKSLRDLTTAFSRQCYMKSDEELSQKKLRTITISFSRAALDFGYCQPEEFAAQIVTHLLPSSLPIC